MSDLIGKQSVIDILHYNCDESCSSIITDIELAPAVDAVEVVRCKDCVYLKKDFPVIVKGALGTCHLLMVKGLRLQCCGCQGDDFCSYGEREESDE